MPRGDEIHDVVRARRGPAERAPALVRVTDQTVRGVDGFVREQAGQPADEKPESRRDDAIVETLREAFDRCGGDAFGSSAAVSRPTICDTARVRHRDRASSNGRSTSRTCV